ncbi:hypothetical protein E2C01_055579 [Portunus trituberculatus]|uniref:Uncharacterized protein n=1 Tax=Portunus trituberculatus TaxID=210409 RepID=A0A5B7GV63_PORTR|nr:hypothetical protein [Portunus trituberculatus]
MNHTPGGLPVLSSLRQGLPVVTSPPSGPAAPHLTLASRLNIPRRRGGDMQGFVKALYLLQHQNRLDPLKKKRNTLRQGFLCSPALKAATESLEPLTLSVL